MKKITVIEFVYELSSLAKIGGVSKMPCCCYDNLLCKTFHQNLFINDSSHLFDTLIKVPMDKVW